jgi:hypothetical protein
MFPFTSRDWFPDNVKKAIKERGRFYLYESKWEYHLTRYAKNTQRKEAIRRTTTPYNNKQGIIDILVPYCWFHRDVDYFYDSTDGKRYFIPSKNK